MHAEASGEVFLRAGGPPGSVDDEHLIVSISAVFQVWQLTRRDASRSPKKEFEIFLFVRDHHNYDNLTAVRAHPGPRAGAILVFWLCSANGIHESLCDGDPGRNKRRVC